MEKNIPVIEKITVAEFRELGYLQELNRLFLHPLGLALEAVLNDDGTESFGEVWDYRDDDEGMWYDECMFDDEFKERAKRIEQEIIRHGQARMEKLGYVIQPYEGIQGGVVESSAETAHEE